MNVKRLIPLLVLPALVACAANASNVSQAQCGTRPVPPQMVNPVNGASGVADGNFQLVLSAPYADSIQLAAPDGTVTTLSPEPVPTSPSSGTPPPSNAYAVGPLQASTMYTVQGYFNAAGPCAAGTVPIGSFTTK
jgi:hypothetical protein